MALKEQANAFVGLAEKCQPIFTAQRAIAAIIPKENDTKNHHSEKYSIFVCYYYFVVIDGCALENI